MSPVWFGKTGLYVVSFFFGKAKNSNFILWVCQCQVRIYLYFEGQRFLKTPVKLKPDTGINGSAYLLADNRGQLKIQDLIACEFKNPLVIARRIFNSYYASVFKMEQEGLGAEDEIHNEPNERETEPLLSFPPEPLAAYEKFLVGRERQQPKRRIIPAQFALKVSFW